MKDNKFSFINRIKSFKYALNGIRLMLKGEHNFLVQLSIAILTITFAFVLKLSTAEFLWIIVAIGLVLSAEMINSAIEKLADYIQPEHDKKVGNIKDIAAGAVLLVSLTAAGIGLIIFIPRILALF